jgi:branched-chain amino acid transport system substrate-binding protein
LEVWDDETKVDKGITGVKKFLFKDKVWGVIGGYRSGVVLAQQDPIMEQKKIFMITDAAATDITDRVGKDYKKYKYTFRSVMNVDQVGQLMLPVLTDVIKAKTYFYIAETTVWSRDLAEILRKAAEAKGIKRVGYVECDPAAQEFTSEMAKIKEAKPDVVLSAISGSADVPFAKQYYDLKVPVPLCFHAAGIMVKVDLAEKGNYLGFMAYTWNIPITPKTVGFHEKFTKVHARPDGWQDVRSYDGMYILIDGIRRAGSLDVEKVVAALEKTDFVGAAGRYVFDEKHQAKWGAGFTEGLILQRVEGKDFVLYPSQIATGKFTRAPWWK